MRLTRDPRVSPRSSLTTPTSSTAPSSTAQDWETYAGDWSQTSPNGLLQRSPTTPATLALFPGPAGTADLTIDVNVTITAYDAHNEGTAGIGFSVGADGESYYVFLSTAQGLGIGEFGSGGFIVVSMAGAAVAVGLRYALRLTVLNGRWFVFLDGEFMLSIYEQEMPEGFLPGRVGVRSNLAVAAWDGFSTQAAVPYDGGD